MNKFSINGTEYPIRFSAKALREFGRLTGKTKYSDLMNIGSDMSLDDMVTFIYCGIGSGAADAGLPFPYTLEEFWDILDKDMNSIGDVFKQYSEDQPPTETEEKKTQAEK